MAQNHNIFADTTLGGVLSFLQQPALTTPTSLLGIPSEAPTAVGRVDDTALKVFLGQSGTANWFAMFDGGNSLVNAPVELQGSFPAWTVHFEGSAKLRDNLLFDSMTAPGTTPANLRVMVADGSTVRFLAPPVPTAEQEFYLRMTTGGLGWAGQAPGGGGATGVEGSGQPDRAAVWSASTSLRTSILKITSSAVEVLGQFNVRPSGGEASPAAFAVGGTVGPPESASITMTALALPDYSSSINAQARALVWSETTALRRASPAMFRGWLDVYTTGEVNSALSGYLPLSAGPTKAITGGLHQSSATPNFWQMDTSGVSTGMANVLGDLVFFQGTRAWVHVRNCIEYYTATGEFRVWQLNNSDATWYSLLVATQQWTGVNYSPLGHRHGYSEIDMGAPYLLGAGSGTQAQQITVGNGLQLTAGGQLNSTALVSSVGLAGPAADTTVTGTNPITTSGTLTWDWLAKGINTVFAGPVSGGSAKPAFRSLVLADIASAALGGGTANSSTVLYGNRQWGALPASSGVTGSGSTDYIARWTSGGSIGNSMMSQNAGQSLVTVAGSLEAVGNLTAGNYVVAPNIDISTLLVYRTTGNLGAAIPRLPHDFGAGKVWVLVGTGTGVGATAFAWAPLTADGTLRLNP
jgi:hypothetical protein